MLKSYLSFMIVSLKLTLKILYFPHSSLMKARKKIWKSTSFTISWFLLSENFFFSLWVRLILRMNTGSNFLWWEVNNSVSMGISDLFRLTTWGPCWQRWLQLGVHWVLLLLPAFHQVVTRRTSRGPRPYPHRAGNEAETRVWGSSCRVRHRGGNPHSKTVRKHRWSSYKGSTWGTQGTYQQGEIMYFWPETILVPAFIKILDTTRCLSLHKSLSAIFFLAKVGFCSMFLFGFFTNMNEFSKYI